MKKLFVLPLVFCALVAMAAVVTADSATVTPTVEPATVELATVLPGTVLDQLTASFSCKYKDLQCPDIYDPVTCSNGVTYPNACYALAACATGCGSGGV